MKFKLSVGIALVTLLGFLGGLGFGSAQASSLTVEQVQDREQFIEILRKARQGDSSAQWQAAETYVRLGETSLAFPLLVSAADSGVVAATRQLAVLYEDGVGVEKSREKAIEWYRVASSQGDPWAWAALARLLPRTDPKVSEFRSKAAAAGNADAQYALGFELTERGDDKSLTEANAWFLKAAEQGHLGAQIALGQHLLEGKGGKTNLGLGLDWLTRAARSGNPVANFLLGRRLLAGDAGERKAAQLNLCKAAEAGHREAQYLCGSLLAETKTLEEKRQAAKWLDQSHSAGHIEATNRLGKLLREPVVGLQQQERARELFLQAAEKGNIDAMYNFAEMQHSGIGGERDTFEALKWYGRAADGKHEQAREVVDALLASSIKTSTLGLKGFWQ